MQIEYLFPLSKWSDIKIFLENNYRCDLALCNQAIFKWQFQHTSDNEKVQMVHAYDAEQLVGILGYREHAMFWGDYNHPLKVAWFMNWMVDEKYRNGLGRVLLRKLLKKYPLLLSIGANEKNEKIVKELGWKFYPYIKRYIAVINESEVKALTQNDISNYMLKVLPSGPLKSLQVTSQYEPDWSLYASMKYAIIRSKEYLQWRYFAHPAFEYRAYYIGDAHRPAVCIYRIENAFGAFHKRVCKIVDFYHPSDTQGVQEALILLGSISGLLQKEGVIYMDFTTSSQEYGETLLKAGFGIEPEGKQVLPARLTPVELKPKIYNFEHSDKNISKVTLDEMYISWADCDEDRVASLNLL